MKRYLTKYELRWALIFSLLFLLWTAFEYEMGWHDEQIKNHKYYTFLFLFIASACYWFFLIDKKSNRFKKRFKFKHAFWSGMGMTLLVAIMIIPAQLLIHNLVSPDYFTEAQNYAISSKEMTKEQAKNTFNIRSFVLFYPLFYMLFGIVISVIFGLILQRDARNKR